MSQNILENWIVKLRDYSIGSQPIITLNELQNHIDVETLTQTTTDERIIQTKIEKAVLLLLIKKLGEKPELNQNFIEKTENSVLNNALTKARLLELQRVKIVRNGPKYNISELKKSFYGEKILHSLPNFNIRKNILTKPEFVEVQKACLKIKLRLPETIRPTTTEKFFSKKE